MLLVGWQCLLFAGGFSVTYEEEPAALATPAQRPNQLHQGLKDSPPTTSTGTPIRSLKQTTGAERGACLLVRRGVHAYLWIENKLSIILMQMRVNLSL